MSTRQGKTSLGIDDNNPGNIRRVAGVHWRGESDRKDSPFCDFTDSIYGIRAMERALLVMYHEEGFKTIEEIITRWAPPSENDTQAYIDAVSKAFPLLHNLPLVMPDDLFTLCKAIIEHENGMQPYADIVFEDAFTLLEKENLAYVR